MVQYKIVDGILIMILLIIQQHIIVCIVEKAETKCLKEHIGGWLLLLLTNLATLTACAMCTATARTWAATPITIALGCPR